MTWDQYAQGAGGGPGPAVPPMPSAPPAAPADPLRAAAVALLNLSGLGLGYLLMRRWVAMAACLAATAALLFTALPADSDGVPLPLVLVYVLVLLAAAAHGGFGALRRHLSLPVRGPVALGLGIVLLAVPVGGTALWTNAHDEAVQRMLLGRLAAADHLVAGARGEGFPTAQHAYRSALGTYRDLADHHAGSRAARKVPASLTAFYQAVATPYARQDYCNAIAPLSYLRSLPSTAAAKDLGSLAHWPDPRLATSYYHCGVSQLTSASDNASATAAAGQLGRLLDTFPDSGEAKSVGSTVDKLIGDAAGGLPGDDPCGVRDRLTRYRAAATSLTQLSERLTHAKAVAGRGIVTGTYDCGLDQYRAGDFGAALTTMKGFAGDHPHDGRAAYAKKVSIAAEIAKSDAAAGKHLPTHASPGGPIPVTFSNASPDKVTVYFTGSVTGSVTLPACGSCHTLSSESAASSVCHDDARYPKHTLHLPAGTTYFMQHADGDTNTLDSHTRSSHLRSGYEYTECAYVVRESAFGF